MSFVMTRDERETFLAGMHVGVLALNEESRGPLAAPVWYDYEPGGELWFVTDRDSRKGRLIEVGTRISLCAQSEEPPYRYVSVEGPVREVSPADVEAVTRPMARRYLGREAGDDYIERTGGEGARGDSIVVRMRPDRWLSVDYGKS